MKSTTQTAVHLTPVDREAIDLIKAHHGMTSTSSAIRYALRHSAGLSPEGFDVQAFEMLLTEPAYRVVLIDGLIKALEVERAKLLRAVGSSSGTGTDSA